MLLCGDIGATKTTLALFAPGDPLTPLAPATFSSPAFPGLEDILAAYVAGQTAIPAAACFGIAGPVLGERVATTNLPWIVDSATLRDRLGGAPVALLNDLEALAYGVLALPPDRLRTLRPGRPHAGTIAVIAAGTGLGEAGLVWDGTRHVALASEGGHADFAPRSDREIALLRYLHQRHAHVSWEHVVSGPGLQSCFAFLRDAEGMAIPDTFAADADPATITAAALAGTPPIAVEALALFVSCYGAEAGNLALKLKATGGVYVGGGIAPRILPALERGTFTAAFLAKGRFESLLADIPLHIVLDPRTALYGAARHAATLLAAC